MLLYSSVMVFGGSFGRRRRYREFGYGPPRGYRQPGGGSCLRDIFLLEGGCCLAELLGCGVQLMLVGPALLRQAVRPARERGTTGASAVLLVMIKRYQQQISPRRRPCCRYSPTCSTYAFDAILLHGARKGAWLAARRLMRCRPGAACGVDTVPTLTRC
jgi:putative membrane protein insertion efficiency factor